MDTRQLSLEPTPTRLTYDIDFREWVSRLGTVIDQASMCITSRLYMMRILTNCQKKKQDTTTNWNRYRKITQGPIYICIDICKNQPPTRVSWLLTSKNPEFAESAAAPQFPSHLAR